MPRGSTTKICPFCQCILFCAQKTCSNCKKEQPIKQRLKKKLQRFDEKREKWVAGHKKNHNIAAIKDDSIVMLEKLHAIGYKPVLLLRKETKKKENKCEILTPRCTTSAQDYLQNIGSVYENLCEVNDCKPRLKTESRRNTHSEEISLDMSVVEEDIELESCISTQESSLLSHSRTATPTQPRQRSSNPLSTGQATNTPTPGSCQQSSSFSPHSTALVAEHQQGKQNGEVGERFLHIMTQPKTPVAPHMPREVEEMYHFSLSLVPKLNRLLPKNQTKAQIHILQYLADLELEDEQQRQQPTPTQPAFSSRT